jgi:hypothetical protein
MIANCHLPACVRTPENPGVAMGRRTFSRFLETGRRLHTAVLE